MYAELSSPEKEGSSDQRVCQGDAEWVVPQAPQHSPRLEAQIPAVKAEESHIMPGNKPAAAADQPEAPFRSFILLGQSLFLGGGGRG